MLKSKIILMLIIITLSFSSAGCYVYYEQSFKGTILDIDTKQPIEGVVVVAQYSIQSWFLSPDSQSSVMDFREQLTDKEGKFFFLPYVTLLTPLSWKIPTQFIIFKAGYASVMSREFPFNGEEISEELRFCIWRINKCKFRRGVVEMPQISTYSERRVAIRDAVVGNVWKLPRLYDAINKESKKLNMPTYDKPKISETRYPPF